MINELKQYLKSTLGIDVPLTGDTSVKNRLPFAVSQRYSVYASVIFGRKACFAIDKDTTTPSGYEKEASLIGRIAQVPVIIVTENVKPVDTHRMIQKRIDFIVPGKRMFMPTLMIDLGGRYPHKAVSDIIPPIAQAIVLFQLQIGSLNGLDAKDISSKFGITYLTASRALNWIGENISPLKQVGRKYLLELPDRTELLSKVKPYLRTPVVKRIQTDDSIIEVDGIPAGETALEEYSMIAASGQCKAISRKNKVDIVTDARGLNCIEVWMYDPVILAEGGVCDRISLILSLSDNTDERIHKEVESLKTAVGW